MKSTTKIAQLFASGKAHIAYLTAGDGGMRRTFEAAMALIAGGVNMLEIGVPFSDPVADGLVIQEAAVRALQAKTTMKKVLKLAKKIRQESDIPLILFSYVNPIIAAVTSFNFFQAAKHAGINGLLLVDCPYEEAASLYKACIQHDIAPIYVIASSTPSLRIRQIDHYGQGFLYYACRLGTTGIKNELPENFINKIVSIRSLVHLPIVVGFGISNAAMVQQVLQYADGVVVGSLFVKSLNEGMSMREITSLAQSIYTGHSGV